jgi:hypothetical protein
MTSETYAAGGQLERAGGFIIACAALLSAALVIAGLIYATGTPGRTRAALAAAGCEPTLSPPGQQCTTRQNLASSYLTITTPADQQLTADIAAYTASEKHNLTAAEAALTAEVTTEQAFDKSLAAATFTPQITAIATALIHADQALATLTTQQAHAATLTQLRSYNHRIHIASAAVQTQAARIRHALGLPASR